MKPKMLQWNEKFAYIFIDIIIIIDYFANILSNPLLDLYIACLIHCSTQIRIKYHFCLLLFLCHRNRRRHRCRYENEYSKKKKEYSY